VKDQNMTRRFALAAVCAVALTVTGYAQKKPDFNGTWVPDPAATSGANAAPAGGAASASSASGGGELVVKQTAESFIIERKGPSGVQTQNYKLNGTEQEVITGQLKMKAKPRWDGDKIVVEITRPAQDGTMFTTTTTYSIDKDGRLWLETPTSMGTRKVAYKKKPAEASKAPKL
jgi:hypothetical protein